MAYIVLGRKSWEITDFTNGNHNTSVPELMSEVGYVVSNSWRAGSVSTVTIDEGTRTFVTNVVVPWVVNTPIRAVDTSVSGKYVSGLITSITHSETTSTVTLDVEQVGGSGSHSSWNLIVCPERTTVMAANPAGTTIGGTGSTTPAGARKNLETPRQIDIIGVCAAPPASGSTGSKVLITAGFGVSLDPAWSGKGGQIVTKTGTGWDSFQTAVIGDQCFDLGGIGGGERSGGGARRWYTYQATGVANSIGATSGSWVDNTDTRMNYSVITGDTTLNYTYHGKVICVRSSSDVDLTLDHTVVAAYNGVSMVVVNDCSSGHSVTIGGVFQKNNAGSSYLSSIIIYPGQSVMLLGTSETGSTMNYIAIKGGDLENPGYAFMGLLVRNTDTVDLLSGQTIEWPFDGTVYDTLGAMGTTTRFTVPAGISKCQVTINAYGTFETGSKATLELKNYTDSGQSGTFMMPLTEPFASHPRSYLSATSGWMLVTPGDEFGIEANNGGSADLGEVNISMSVRFEV